MAKLTPLYDKIIVKADELVQKSAAGLILTASKEKPKYTYGTVLAIGHGRLLKDGTRDPLVVKVGDRVVFATSAGAEIELDGEKFLVVQEVALHGIVQ